MTLEPDRRSLPGIGHHGYPLARPPAQKLARTGGALHLQASSQFTVCPTTLFFWTVCGHVPQRDKTSAV